MITLQDAVERAEIMAGDSGDLKQESYNLLVSQLEDKDVYPFTIALVERNLNVRTGANHEFMEEIVYGTTPISPKEDIGDRLARAAQTMRQKNPGGLWVPEQYIQDEPPAPPKEEPLSEAEYLYGWKDDPQYKEEPLSEAEYLYGWKDDPQYEDFEEDSYDYEPIQKSSLQDELEALGISLTPDGQVVFYQSNIPGVYTRKNPMPPMPLDTAFKYYDQTLKSVGKEQERVNGLQNYLSKLNSATSEIESSLRELESFKYSPESRSKDIQAIANGLEEVKTDISNGDWRSAHSSLDNLQGVLDTYSGTQYEKYDQYLKTMETLDKLMDVKEQDPGQFKQISEGLGAIPYARAARWKRRRNMALEDLTFFPVESSNMESFAWEDLGGGVGNLYVKFLAKGNSLGSTYIYENVDIETYNGLWESPSKGRYVWTHLRDRFEYKRLE